MTPRESYIRAIILTGLEEYCFERGCNARELLEEVGIPLSALNNPDDLISFRRLVTLWELTAKTLNMPNFGLVFSQSAAPNYVSLGPSVLMAKFVSNTREWQQTAIRYWSFFTNGFAMQLIEPDGQEHAVLRLHINALTMPARQYTEALIANIFGVTRVVANNYETKPIAIRFQHHRPADTTEHLSYFGCPVEFGCDHVEIEFEKRVLEMPTTGSATVFKPMMKFYISERIRRMKLYDYSAAATTALAISSLLGSGNCNLETVAEFLTNNAKALQRQLAKEDTNFAELLDQVRENMARHLLVETDAPVAHVAGLLDYSTTAPFTTAFERWTGTTPLRFRKQERDKRSDPQPGQSMSVDN